MALTTDTNVSAWLRPVSISTRWHPTLPILSVRIEDSDRVTSSVVLSLSPEQIDQLREALENAPAQPQPEVTL